MRIVFGLILCLAMGCAPAEDHHLDVIYDICEPVVVEPPANASAAQLASLDEAIEMWRAAGVARLGRAAPDTAPEVPRVRLRFQRAAPMFYGLYEDERGEIVINTEVRDHRARAVVIAHELGHAFGLWHIDGRRSVMNSGNRKTPPGPGDLRDLLSVWGPCDPESPPPEAP